MNPKPEDRFEELLSLLVDADLSAAEQDELAALCQGHSGRARRLREELEFADMLRQAVSPEPFSTRVQTRLERGPAEFDPLLHKLLDDEADSHDIAALEHLCVSEPRHARRLSAELAWNDLLDQTAAPHRGEEAFVDSLVTRMWAQTEEDDFLGRLESKIAERHPENVESFPAPPSRRWMPYFAAAAAVIAAAATFALRSVPSALPTVASLHQTAGEVRWGEGFRPDESGRFRTGNYRLESGVVTLRFDSGTELALEGPAEFDVTGASGANVLKGLAIARTTQQGTLFALKSRGLDLGETGDTIGVDARESEATEAVVFNGGAELRAPDFGAGKTRSLYEFEAVRAEFDRSKLVDVPYNPAPFAQAWAMVSGVQSNNGNVTIEPPGSQQKPGRASDPGRVQVYLEKERVRIEEPLEVDPIQPGKLALNRPSRTVPTLPRGELRSYLVQLWPHGDAKEKSEASLTFSSEVVGVIYSSDGLDRTDALVGATEKPQASRGLDLDGDDSPDEIVLSPDRRTVNFKLSSGGQDHLDEVRILVAVQ